MLKDHKRTILIVDDEMINRGILGNMLKNDYDLLYAGDGQEALDKIRANRDQLSLVLLDLLMPQMNGFEVLKQKRTEPEIAPIPVIVATSDAQSEVECLTLGAVDFIPKPYNNIDVIKARVLRTIELFEDRKIINTTERDPLTGLYNKDYFFNYCEQYDGFRKGQKMDAVLLDVYHFHILNERFGNAYGDKVLKIIAERLCDQIHSRDGMVCRLEADTFIIYCPHGEDYKQVLNSVSRGLIDENSANAQIRIRMGVYEDVDKSLEIPRRFDRAKMAADTLRSSMSTGIAIYNEDLYDKEIFEEKLVEDFSKAITDGQFEVYYQPKYDIQSEEPILASAEALVRWKHPQEGMIAPGVFVPLFEKNGLIYELDNFVWQSAAAQVADWKKRFGITVPVSVNVSRVDMYDPHLELVFEKIIEDNGISANDLYLEITESAYTQDSKQIINTVNSLRAMGFKVEMDDFGTGYSSLNMISVLPIDVLKLDMQFIRNAFDHNKDTGMIDIMLDIADYLNVPVIAEGVETREQMEVLKKMGCDVIQGYYFSKPVPAKEFEKFIIEKKKQQSR